MKLIEMKVKDFVNEVDSASPAPGGGSVSALASALGLALARMVGHLTFGKKKYNELSSDVRRMYEDSFNSLDDIKNKLFLLVDKDTEAFENVMTAFRLPKETDTEKEERNKEIQKATVGAINIPLGISALSYEALRIIDRVKEYGNKNALSDIGVGCLLIHSGLEGGILNVKINLSGLTDEALKGEYVEKAEKLVTEGKKIRENILNYINERL